MGAETACNQFVFILLGTCLITISSPDECYMKAYTYVAVCEMYELWVWMSLSVSELVLICSDTYIHSCRIHSSKDKVIGEKGLSTELKLRTYAVSWSFSHANYQSWSRSFVPNCPYVPVCVDVQAYLRMYVCYDGGVFVDNMSLMCRIWLVSIIPFLCMHLFCSVGLQWTLWTGGQRSRIHPTSSV